jgi:hypothetical protein
MEKCGKTLVAHQISKLENSQKTRGKTWNIRKYFIHAHNRQRERKRTTGQMESKIY